MCLHLKLSIFALSKAEAERRWKNKMNWKICLKYVQGAPVKGVTRYSHFNYGSSLGKNAKRTEELKREEIQSRMRSHKNYD